MNELKFVFEDNNFDDDERGKYRLHNMQIYPQYINVNLNEDNIESFEQSYYIDLNGIIRIIYPIQGHVHDFSCQ